MPKYMGELLIKADGKSIAYTQSCALNFSTAFQDVTSKDSGDFEESEPGLKSWGASGDGLASISDDGTTTDTVDLIQYWLEQRKVTVIFNAKDNLFTLTGTAFFEKVDISSKTKERPTFSFSLKGSGTVAPTRGTAYKVDGLTAAVLSDTSLSLTYNATGTFTKAGLEASADGATGWAKVGADITAAPYKSYQILTVAAGTKYYRAWVSDATNVKQYSNTLQITI